MGVTNTPRNSAAYGNFMSFAGRVVFFVGHSLATFPLENWAQLIDALQASGVQIMTLPEAVKHVRNSGLWATADSGKTWTRTLSDASDYRLKPGSPCRNAGVSVGLVSDFAGKMIRGNPDIGAYEYFNPAGGGGFGDFNFSLGW